MVAACKHTLDCYSWFPEHIRVFQQLRLISVDSDDLTAPVENSAIAQPEVTHSPCERNTRCSSISQGLYLDLKQLPGLSFGLSSF